MSVHTHTRVRNTQVPIWNTVEDYYLEQCYVSLPEGEHNFSCNSASFFPCRATFLPEQGCVLIVAFFLKKFQIALFSHAVFRKATGNFSQISKLLVLFYNVAVTICLNVEKCVFQKTNQNYTDFNSNLNQVAL